MLYNTVSILLIFTVRSLNSDLLTAYMKPLGSLVISVAQED